MSIKSLFWTGLIVFGLTGAVIFSASSSQMLLHPPINSLSEPTTTLAESLKSRSQASSNYQSSIVGFPNFRLEPPKPYVFIEERLERDEYGDSLQVLRFNDEISETVLDLSISLAAQSNPSYLKGIPNQAENKCGSRQDHEPNTRNPSELPVNIETRGQKFAWRDYFVWYNEICYQISISRLPLRTSDANDYSRFSSDADDLLKSIIFAESSTTILQSNLFLPYTQ